MKKFYLLFLWGISLCAEAQTISSAVIASGGNFVTTSTASLSSTIGQSFAGSVTQNNITLHQGFQISLSDTEIVTAVVDEKLTLNIFPNPTTQQLFIEGGNELASYSFEFIDFSGRTLPVEQTKTKKSVALNLSDLQPALYLLRIHTPKGIVQTISILKSN